MRVFIGMPTYERFFFIRQAIESIINQSYKDWILFVSNDQSDIKINKYIVENLAVDDNRIIYHQQTKSLGLINNFNFLANEFLKSDCDLFMWIGDDDYLNKDYLKNSVNIFKANSELELVANNHITVDTYGRTIRTYKSFNRFKKKKLFLRALNYFFEPEILGKGNLFTGIFSRKIIYDIFSISKLKHMYFDYNLSYLIIFNGKFITSENSLFFKRYALISDTPKVIPKIKKLKFRNYLFSQFSVIKLLGHTKAILSFNRVASYRLYTLLLFAIRLPLITLITLSHYILNLLKKISTKAFSFNDKIWQFDMAKIYDQMIVDGSILVQNSRSGQSLDLSIEDIKIIDFDESNEEKRLVDSNIYKLFKSYKNNSSSSIDQILIDMSIKYNPKDLSIILSNSDKMDIFGSQISLTMNQLETSYIIHKGTIPFLQILFELVPQKKLNIESSHLFTSRQ